MATVVFYDSLCSVCNYWVNWILENDSKGVLFSALESDFTIEFSHSITVISTRNHSCLGQGCRLLEEVRCSCFYSSCIKTSLFSIENIKTLPNFQRYRIPQYSAILDDIYRLVSANYLCQNIKNASFLIFHFKIL